jgi:hypothetical protein
MNLVIVEQVFESTQESWIHRFRVVDGRAMVSRVPADRPLWNHGVIKQIFDRDVGRFVITINAGSNVWFNSLDDAIKAVDQ